jgi:hypothetical protein
MKLKNLDIFLKVRSGMRNSTNKLPPTLNNDKNYKDRKDIIISKLSTNSERPSDGIFKT